MQTMFDLYEILNFDIHVEEEGKHQNSSLGLGKKIVYRNNTLHRLHWLIVVHTMA